VLRIRPSEGYIYNSVEGRKKDMKGIKERMKAD
jgi:hypothetical protein